MSDISGELRKFTNTYHLNSLQVYELNHIADRIRELAKKEDRQCQ